VKKALAGPDLCYPCKLLNPEEISAIVSKWNALIFKIYEAWKYLCFESEGSG
jgi:hypothetical protein